MNRAHLAIDQGGHASRALVFDATGRLLGSAIREVRERRLRPGWVEQDPEELVGSIRAATAEVLRQVPASEFRVSSGMATQRSSIVCWNRRTGESLSPVLSWQDRRAHAWLAGLAGHAATIHRKTGLRLTAHYGASKLRWCLRNIDAVRQARRDGELLCGPLAAFLAFRLLDDHPTLVDPANAARTLLWNLHELDWDGDLLELFEVPREVLPDCVPTRHAYGALTSGGRRIPMSIVTGDQSAALFAHGFPDPATAYVNLGTGAFVQRVLGADPGSVPGLLTGVVLQDGDEVTWVIEGTVNGAGSALIRVAGELGVSDVDRQLSGWLERASDPPLFVNAVSGLGSPWWIADLESEFVGEGEPWEKMVAVAESVAFLVTVNVQCLQQHASNFDRILATGGLAWNDALCQRLADLGGLPVDRPAEYEATARGTAYLVAERPQAWAAPDSARRFKPRHRPALQARFERFKEALASAIGAQGQGRGIGDTDAGGQDAS
jgi:glycerol kinase